MNRTIVVTGAASGIDAATVERLKSAGERVIGVDLRNADVKADLGRPGARIWSGKFRALPRTASTRCSPARASHAAICRVKQSPSIISARLRRWRDCDRCWPNPRGHAPSPSALPPPSYLLTARWWSCASPATKRPHSTPSWPNRTVPIQHQNMPCHSGCEARRPDQNGRARAYC